MALFHCLNSAKNMTRCGNLIQQLLEYTFVITHIPSERNLSSDFTSRIYDSNLYEYVETNPDENLDLVQGGCFGSFWSLPIVPDYIKNYIKKKYIINNILRYI